MVAQLLSLLGSSNDNNLPVRQLASQVCGLHDVVVIVAVAIAPVAACCMSRLACSLGKCLLSVACAEGLSGIGPPPLLAPRLADSIYVASVYQLSV